MIMSQATRLLLTVPLLAALNANAQTPTAPVRFESPRERTSLLELYTSEGCSSCPPAETWLAGLTKSPRLWREFVPVAFHVDYWNNLGWTDPWSDAAYSARQRDYAQAWRSENIYTPEYVLNGREWRNWFTGKNGPAATGENTGVLTVTATGPNRWQVRFLPETPSADRYKLHAALLAGGLDSAVKAGENAGRTLHHEFAVLNLVHAGTAVTNGVVRGKFYLPAPAAPAGTTRALAVWLTREGALEPVQATGGWLVVPPEK